jgi:hypothetical protein
VAARKKTGLEDAVAFDPEPSEERTLTVTVPADFVTKNKLTATRSSGPAGWF